MGISREILATGFQILENFPCSTEKLVLYYIHRLMLDNLKIYWLRSSSKTKGKQIGCLYNLLLNIFQLKLASGMMD